MFANTPGYLLRHFRAHPGVRALADKISAEELVAAAKQIDEMKERGPEAVTAAYVALVGLLFKDLREARKALEGVSFEKLDWANRVITTVLEPRIVTETAHWKGGGGRMSTPRGEIVSKDDSASETLLVAH